MLHLYEELFLLCLHEEKVVVMPAISAQLGNSLGGAILIDLALANKICVTDKHRVELLDSQPTGDPLLDETLEKILATEGHKKVAYWLEEFDFRPKKLFPRLYRRLVEQGVLKEEDDDFKWGLHDETSTNHPTSAKYALKSRMRDLTLAYEEADLHQISLLSVLQASEMLDLVFFKDERKLARRRIDEAMLAEALRDPLAQTVQEIGSGIAARIDSD